MKLLLNFIEERTYTLYVPFKFTFTAKSFIIIRYDVEIYKYIIKIVIFFVLIPITFLFKISTVKAVSE
jgi:hypothetical protein